MISSGKLSHIQKGILNDLINKAKIRYKEHSDKYQANPSHLKLIETYDVQDYDLPANDFIKMAFFMFRQVLYGDDTQNPLEEITTKPAKYISRKLLINHLQFIRETFYFSRLSIQTPKIKTFEQKMIKKNSKEVKEVFRNQQIIFKVQQLAKMVHTSLENIFVQMNIEKMKKDLEQQIQKDKNNSNKTYPPEINQCLHRVKNIIDNIDKNYPWDLWKQEQILAGIQKFKDMEYKKQLKQLDFQELLLVSYSRQQIKHFRLHNLQNQMCENSMKQLLKMAEQRNQQRNMQLNFQPFKHQAQWRKIQAEMGRENYEEGQLERQGKSRQQNTLVSDEKRIIKELSELERKMKEKNEKGSSVKGSSVKEKRLPRRINQRLERCENVKELNYQTKVRQNQKIVESFLRVHRMGKTGGGS